MVPGESQAQEPGGRPGGKAEISPIGGLRRLVRARPNPTPLESHGGQHHVSPPRDLAQREPGIDEDRGQRLRCVPATVSLDSIELGEQIWPSRDADDGQASRLQEAAQQAKYDPFIVHVLDYIQKENGVKRFDGWWSTLGQVRLD